jgi:iduronate 2-sulfatase
MQRKKENIMKTSRRSFLKKSCIANSMPFMLPFLSTCARSEKPNVVFLVAEDLNPDTLGAYGNQIAKTPNLDRLGKKGAVFQSAYCNAGTCLPSRTSFMTGLRPETTGQFGSW